MQYSDFVFIEKQHYVAFVQHVVQALKSDADIAVRIQAAQAISAVIHDAEGLPFRSSFFFSFVVFASHFPFLAYSRALLPIRLPFAHFLLICHHFSFPVVLGSGLNLRCFSLFFRSPFHFAFSLYLLWSCLLDSRSLPAYIDTDPSRPLIPVILDEYFRMLDAVGLQRVVDTLEILVQKFEEDMGPYAVQLSNTLVCHRGTH